MVTQFTNGDRSLRDDRTGQLLLVGALVIAVIIIAFALVINTVLFTENLDAEGISAEVDGVEEFTFQSGQTTRSVLLRVNHEEHNRTVLQLQENVTRAIGGYSEALARSQAISGTAYANISYRTTFHNGTRIIQPKDRNFTEPDSNDLGWDVIGDETDIGWFLLNVNLRNTTAEQSTISITNDSSDTLEYSLNRSEDGDGNNLSVVVGDGTGSVLDTVNCTATGGRALVDLYDGGGSGENCSFDGIGERLDSPYEVSISDGDQISGKYSIVAETEWGESIGPSGGFASCYDSVCTTPAVWNGSVNLTYQSDSIQYAQQRNITVYRGAT